VGWATVRRRPRPARSRAAGRAYAARRPYGGAGDDGRTCADPGASPPPPSPAILGQLDVARASASVPSHFGWPASEASGGPELSPRVRRACGAGWAARRHRRRGRSASPVLHRHGTALGSQRSEAQSGLGQAYRKSISSAGTLSRWGQVSMRSGQPRGRMVCVCGSPNLLRLRCSATS
jgi:hypothetical protein